MKDVNARNWFGDVTIENIKEVASAIEKMLIGKRYTFVANNADRLHEMPQVRTLRIAPEKATDVWFDHVECPPRFAGMNVVDTYGVWGFSTSDTEKPYVVFEGEHTIKIQQKNGHGDTLHWVIAVEKDVA